MMICKRAFLSFMIAALLAGVTLAAGAEDAYVRLFPNDGNDINAATGLLRSWPKDGPKLLWRRQIGEGKAAVMVAGGRAFTSTQIDMKQYALCLDPATGKELWRTEISPKDNHHQVKGPVTTPVVDGDRVYYIAYENNAGDVWDLRCPLLCLRVSDGGVIWRLASPYYATEGSIPLIHGDTLYVGANGRESVLLALDKLTGKLRWKAADLEDTGFKKLLGNASSLTWQEVGGIPQIIVSVYRNDQMGVNAETGKVLWHWKFPTPFAPGICATPVALGNKLFLTGFWQPAAWGVCLEMKAKDGGIEPTVLYTDQKLQTNSYNTPSVIDGAVYGFGRGAGNDAIQCTELATGKLLWQHEGPEWSRQGNMTVADGLIFVFTKTDELVLAEVSKTGFKEISRFNPQIKMGFQQQPTFSNGRMYLRGVDTAACYQVGRGE